LLTAFQRANRLDPVFIDLGIFLLLPLSVEMMSLEGTLVGVGLVVSLTIRAFEGMWARFALLYFEARWVCLLICLAIPPKFAVVFGFVRAVAFDIFGALNPA